MVCDGSAQPSFFSVCSRFRSTALLFQASFSFFVLPCVVKSESLFAFCPQTTAVGLELVPFMCLQSLQFW